MALSNILREPRREITESIVGVALVALVMWADYAFAIWLQDGTNAVTNGAGVPWPAGMLIGAILAIVVPLLMVILLFFTHALGDGVCNALQAAGVHLRPRQRRQGR